MSGPGWPAPASVPSGSAGHPAELRRCDFTERSGRDSRRGFAVGRLSLPSRDARCLLPAFLPLPWPWPFAFVVA